MKDNSLIRLQVFLSRNGVCSRRDAMAWIQAGRVSVNGVVTREPSTPVSGEEDIRADGRRVGVKEFEYILLNKPAGYVTTREDRFAERKVLDLLPTDLRHLHPVGRLDKETEGLLLLTNDGDLTQRLTHPSHEIDKVYFARVAGRLSAEAKARLEHGVNVEGRKTSPAKVKDVSFSADATEFLITIHEGRKRQVRLMAQAVGHRVIFLKRIQQGPLTMGNLKTGAWRRLTTKEIEELKGEEGLV